MESKITKSENAFGEPIVTVIYSKFELSFLRESGSPCIEVALRAYNPEEKKTVVDILGYITVDKENSGRAIKLYASLVNHNINVIDTRSSFEEKYDVLADLLESAIDTLPAYIRATA